MSTRPNERLLSTLNSIHNDIMSIPGILTEKHDQKVVAQYQRRVSRIAECVEAARLFVITSGTTQATPKPEADRD